MSAPPVQETTPDLQDQSVEDYTYEGVIPKLGPSREGDLHPSLLPIYGGQPGLEYLQCPVEQQRYWQGEGWKTVRNTNVYTIRGPSGQLDCVLLVKGERLQTSDHQANKRVLFLDPDISRVTGLNSKSGVAVESPEEAAELDQKIAKLEEELKDVEK